MSLVALQKESVAHWLRTTAIEDITTKRVCLFIISNIAGVRQRQCHLVRSDGDEGDVHRLAHVLRRPQRVQRP